VLTNFIKNAASAAGVSLTRHTKTVDVLDLIRKLRPQNCGRPLIRLGGDGDGGYLLPDDLEGIQYCFSPGVGATMDFENDLATFNIKSFLADPSIDSLPVQKPEFTFDRKFLSANDSEISFTLKSWKDKYLQDYSRDLLLQMDIEGYEYEVILSTPIEVLSTFRIMVIEFHYVHKMFDPLIYILYNSCFERILQHFHVAHIHPNNCCGSVRKGPIEVPRVLEFTFYNRNRARSATNEREFPHHLDRNNVGANKPLRLPKCWYS
jgi:hypothetical protein